MTEATKIRTLTRLTEKRKAVHLEARSALRRGASEKTLGEYLADLNRLDREILTVAEAPAK